MVTAPFRRWSFSAKDGRAAAPGIHRGGHGFGVVEGTGLRVGAGTDSLAAPLVRRSLRADERADRGRSRWVPGPGEEDARLGGLSRRRGGGRRGGWGRRGAAASPWRGAAGCAAPRHQRL